jgi:hypothetical protein
MARVSCQGNNTVANTTNRNIAKTLELRFAIGDYYMRESCSS